MQTNKTPKAKTAKKKTKAKRKVRFVEVKVKLSVQQKKQLAKCCKHNKTTLSKVIKKNLNSYLKYYADLLKEDKSITKNQLKLFEPSKNPGKQMQMDIE